MGLEDLVKEAIISYVNAEWRPRDPRTIWVTEVTGCLRRAFLMRVAPQPIEDLRTAFKLIAGEAIHRIVQRHFEGRAEIEKLVILPLDDIEIRGRIDILVKNIVIELKTCIDKPAPDDPLPPHIKQLQYYLNMVDARKGVLIYIDLVRGRVRKFVVKRDGDYMDELVTRARFLKRCLETGRLPKAERLPFNCASCPFSVVCQSRNIEEVARRWWRRSRAYGARAERSTSR